MKAQLFLVPASTDGHDCEAPREVTRCPRAANTFVIVVAGDTTARVYACHRHTVNLTVAVLRHNAAMHSDLTRWLEP